MAEVSVKAAAAGRYSHRYSPITVMSMDFGEFGISRFIECNKGDSFNVKSGGRVRVAPTDFPCYGRSMMKSATLFVPMYQILDNWDSFRENQPTFKGKTQLIPFTNSDFLNIILSQSSYSTQVSSGAISTIPSNRDSYDFILMTGNSTPYDFTTYKLNGRGRRIYKFFKSLGYDFRSYTSANTTDKSTGNIRVNLLSLIAFAKAYTDYFMNVHFYNASPLTALLESIKHGEAYTDSYGTPYYLSTGELAPAAITYIYNMMQVPHISNMYTDAWNNQNSPVGAINTANVNPNSPVSFVLPDQTSHYFTDTLSNTINSVDVRANAGLNNAIYGLTQYGLNSVYSLYEFVRRNNLFGTEAAKLAFARIGIKGDDYNSIFTRKLDENSFDIDFSAIMSNANTYDSNSQSGSVLGAYAGYGIGDIAYNFDYDCSDDGYIFCVSWIQIKQLWLHGFDPSVIRRYPFDWYTPEFDGKASRAISMAEMSLAKEPNNFVTSNDTDIFGFTDLYEEYRYMRDNVLGDFVLGKAKNFVFARDLSLQREQQRVSLKPQTVGVQYYSNTGTSADLTDPFTYGPSDGDRFWVQVNFDISASRPIKSKSEALDLNGTGELNMSTSGNQNS